MQKRKLAINPARREIPYPSDPVDEETHLLRKRSEGFRRDQDHSEMNRFEQERRRQDVARHERITPEEEAREVRPFFPEEDRYRGSPEGDWSYFR
jgi:hypothetical protein